MAGKIVADIIESAGSQISLNVGNVTVLTASSTGLTLTPTSILNINVTNSNITVGSGNVSRPSITFSGNTSTGIFMPAANTIAFGTAGTEDMRINSDGDVGIGTTTPLNTTANRTYLSIKGRGTAITDSFGTLQFQTNVGTPLAGTDIGNIDWNMPTNTSSSSTRVAYIMSEVSGATANNRGASLVFGTKQDGVSGSGTIRMIIDSDGGLSYNSGFGGAQIAYGCRAWVNFDGTGTVAIRGSGNVSSITDGGTGDYTVNFTIAMPDVNYAAVMSGVQGTGTGATGTQYMVGVAGTAGVTTSSVQLYSKYCRPDTSNFIDIAHVDVTIFR